MKHAMTTTSLNVGFIGLGIMGTPMAGHLIKAGHKLFVCTRGKLPQAIADSGATQCANGTQVAHSADIIILMVPDTPDVGEALFGQTGVAKGSAPARRWSICRRSLRWRPRNTPGTSRPWADQCQ